jgi:hypothetical protein
LSLIEISTEDLEVVALLFCQPLVDFG